jgi:hypothetical protein
MKNNEVKSATKSKIENLKYGDININGAEINYFRRLQK